MSINVNKSWDLTKFGFGLNNGIPYFQNEKLKGKNMKVNPKINTNTEKNKIEIKQLK